MIDAALYSAPPTAIHPAEKVARRVAHGRAVIAVQGSKDKKLLAQIATLNRLLAWIDEREPESVKPKAGTFILFVGARLGAAFAAGL